MGMMCIMVGERICRMTAVVVVLVFEDGMMW